MHAFIDQERFPAMTLDAALRAMLRRFRLPGALEAQLLSLSKPAHSRLHLLARLASDSGARAAHDSLQAGAGEAQKIDRIMEKFAERYCRDNPGTFASADAAYILAFALIMLNTDAHNPQADKKIAQEDFIGMSQTQVLAFSAGNTAWLRTLFMMDALQQVMQSSAALAVLLQASVPRALAQTSELRAGCCNGRLPALPACRRPGGHVRAHHRGGDPGAPAARGAPHTSS